MTLEKQIEERLDMIERRLKQLAGGILVLMPEAAWQCMKRTLDESKLSRRAKLEFYESFSILLAGVVELREDREKDKVQS